MSGFKTKSPFSRLSELFMSSHVVIGRRQPSAKCRWAAALLVMVRQTGHRLYERHKGHFSPTHPTLPPSVSTRTEAGGQDSGTVGQTEEEGGLGGPAKDTLSCPELLRQPASPIVQQHPPFFIHHPLCPPPLCFYSPDCEWRS